MHRARSVFLWAIVAIFEIVLITLPVSLQAQLIAGISVVTLMGVIKILNAQGTWRLVSLALGTGIVLRYVYWRTTEHAAADRPDPRTSSPACCSTSPRCTAC
jgi:cellulose synthase (UDP-forming)